MQNIIKDHGMNYHLEKYNRDNTSVLDAFLVNILLFGFYRIISQNAIVR
jgi:hypothetical protein